jgi:hypothetical protein
MQIRASFPIFPCIFFLFSIHHTEETTIKLILFFAFLAERHGQVEAISIGRANQSKASARLRVEPVWGRVLGLQRL